MNARMRARMNAPMPTRPTMDRSESLAVPIVAASEGQAVSGPGPGDAARRWVDVCAVDDVPVQGARVVRRARGGDLALFRTVDGRVFALRDRCPHKGGPLSQGIVHGDRVSCPLHAWSIGLADGAAAAPDVGCTRAFAVRVEGGRVSLDAAQLDAAD
jgi:nitrite reductase (NADH) small subunit